MIAQRRNWFLFVLVLCATLLVSCASNSRKSANEETAAEPIVSTTPPFSTKEPDRYQAVRTTILTDSTGHSTTTKTLIARYGLLRREESENEFAQKLVVLDLENGRIVLLPTAKVYSDGNAPNLVADPEGEVDNSPERLLHQEPIATSYENLGPELVSGRNATKYRVVVNSSTSPNVSRSESLIWIDKSLGIPIKSQTQTNDGSQTLMEMSEISLEVDEKLFQMPAGYEKIAPDELRRRLGKN